MALHCTERIWTFLFLLYHNPTFLFSFSFFQTLFTQESRPRHANLQTPYAPFAGELFMARLFKASEEASSRRKMTFKCHIYGSCSEK